MVYLPGLSTHHGLPTGVGRWAERREVKPYARRHHVWWMQRPAGLPVGTSIADLADAYADVLRDAFDHPVDVVGFSTGGSVALQLAADHPEVVRRLVLLSAACRLGPLGRDEQRHLAGLLRAHRTREAGALLLSLAPIHRTSQRTMAALGWLLGPVIFRGDPGDLLVTVDAEDGFDLTARLPTVTARTLVVGGGRDRFYGTDLFRETATGLLPRAGCRRIPRRDTSARTAAARRSSTCCASSTSGDGPAPGRPARRRPAPRATAGQSASSRRHLVVGQLEVGRRRGVGDRLGPLGARDRDHHRRLRQLPGERDLLGADAAGVGDLLERRVLVGQLLRVAQPAERAPGQERQAELRAHVDLGTAAAERRRELVLHADQRVAERLVRLPDLGRVGVGEPDHPDLAGGVDLGRACR